MRFTFVTLFPDILESYLNASIIKRARERKNIEFTFVNVRDFAIDKHRTVDGSPYGGGAGMVLMAEPLLKAVDSVRIKKPSEKIVLLSAKGKNFNQKRAMALSKKYDHIIFICGRYEGIDERVKKILKAEEISIGPYVLTDGDIAAAVMVSAIARLVPGVIRLESLAEESHWQGLLKDEADSKKKGLEYPHYTRPETLIYANKKHTVPKVLISGNHAKIKAWRKKQSR